MNFKHVIWDWNGTLWDDTGLCVEINNHMLRRRGLPDTSPEFYRDRLCFPVSDYYCQLGFDYAETSYEKLAEEFIAEYSARRFECPLQPGARELILELRDRGVPQAVLSAYEQQALLEASDHFELTAYFDDIVGLNDIYASGKVENGLKYIAGLQLDPATVLFVGDTVHDFEVAEAMGVNAALVACGHNSRERLEATGAPVVDSLKEIRGLVFESEE